MPIVLSFHCLDLIAYGWKLVQFALSPSKDKAVEGFFRLVPLLFGEEGRVYVPYGDVLQVVQYAIVKGQVPQQEHSFRKSLLFNTLQSFSKVMDLGGGEFLLFR